MDETFEPELTEFADPSPAAELTVASKADVTHFCCSACRSEFTVPNSGFANDVYSTRCFSCDNSISIQTIHSQSNMDIIELHGCEYGHTAAPLAPVSTDQIMNWIETDVGSTPTIVSHKPLEGDESLIETLVAKWTVNQGFGKKLQFEYFSAIRTSIENGEIKAKDKITAPDGKTYRVDEYPGTADLFGNAQLKSAARHEIATEPKKRPSSAKHLARKTKQFLIYMFCAASLTSLGYYAPRYYSRWVKMQGSQTVSEIISNVHLTGSEDIQKIAKEARNMFKTKNPDLLPKVVEGFAKVLAANPTSAQSISELAESMLVVGGLTADRVDLDKAQELLAYAKALDPKNAVAIRTEARLLWKTKKYPEAMALIEQQPGSFLNDAETHYLLAQIARDAGDMTKASIQLNEAIALDPTNTTYLLAFADLFESQQKFPQAVTYLQKAADLSGHSDAFSARLGALYEKSRDSDSAIRVYKNAIAKGEQPEQNLYALIKVLMKSDMYTRALQESLNYLSQYPDGSYRAEVSGIYQSALAKTEPARVSTSSGGGRRSRSR
jgi:tetratricopeptide (TPR) repeat protein